MNYLEKIQKFKNSKEKSSLTNGMWVNNNTRIKHEDRFFSQIQFVVVLSWLTFYLFHIIFQLNYEGDPALRCFLARSYNDREGKWEQNGG